MDYSLVLSEFYSKFAFMLNGNSYEGLNWLDDPSKKPSDEELKSKYNEAVISKKHKLCKNQVKKLLTESDWSETISAQMDLANGESWINYRRELRKLLVHPTENPVFPTKPEIEWKI